MSALNVTIDPSIKGAWPEARLGCFIYTADVRAREDSLWTCLENEVAPYLKTMLETTPLAQIPNLAESRKAYKAFGKAPGRFRVSSESLYRRVRQGKALYQINSVVDANTLVSLETGFSLGSYDTARIGADIVYRLGKAGEVYPGIGKDDIRAHARQALENVDRVLKAAGSDRTKVVQCRVYTTKGEYWGPVNEEYAAYFGDHRPARIVVTVPELHFGCLVEIEAVAEL